MQSPLLPTAMPQTVSPTAPFAALLAQYGPQAAGRAVSLSEAERFCRQLAAGHYENFPVLSVAVPRGLRQDFANVYAWCRWADDLGDEVAGTDASRQLLDWWGTELADCYAGRAWHPIYVALRQTIAKHGLPQRPFEDLISAFQQDQRLREYESYEELRDYCRRSADPVGRIVLRLCGQYSTDHLALSDSVCTGLQLVNFWQDVARDADIGRVYLPRLDRQRFGYSDDDLAARRTNPAFINLLRFEVGRARQLLQIGLPLADRMPGRLKVVIALFALGGLKICDQLQNINHDVWKVRPKLTKTNAAGLLLRATSRAASVTLRRTR